MSDSSVELLRLVDPEGSVLIVGKVGDAAYTLGLELADPSQPFRMFEDNRAKMRAFLRPLVG